MTLLYSPSEMSAYAEGGDGPACRPVGKPVTAALHAKLLIPANAGGSHETNLSTQALRRAYVSAKR